MCPEIWKKTKMIPLLKDSKSALTGPNSRPISLLPVLSKLLEKMLNVQIQDYFTSNQLFTSNQHAYKVGNSTSAALAQMTDDGRSMENNRSVGEVLLDFSAALDIIDHCLLLEKNQRLWF